MKRFSLSRIILAVLVACSLLPLSNKVHASEPQTYYVSESSGNDGNVGLSPDSPWQTLTKVSSVTFHPGDTILLKRGDTWTGETLYLNGSGSSENWITLSAYGTGDRPKITPYTSQADIPAANPTDVSANGLLHAIKLHNTAGWKIAGLEIAYAKSGIVYVNETSGPRDGLWVEDCYIHDITKWPMDPFPSAENRPLELRIMPYSVGLYIYQSENASSVERLQNVTVKNTTFQWTDSPLEIRHSDNVTIEGITATDSYREGVQLTGINVGYPGTPVGTMKNSVILRSGLSGMTWGTAGLQFNAVHSFVADNVEVGFTQAPNAIDGVGVDYEGLNKDVTLKNSNIHDNADEAVMIYRNPQWSGGVENVNTSLIDNVFTNNGINNDGNPHAAFLTQQYNLTNGGTISGNTIVKAKRSQPLNMIVERSPQYNDFWPSSGYTIFNNTVKMPNGNIVHYASTGFSDTQGKNNWSYLQNDGSAQSHLTWSPGGQLWESSANRPLIGEDWQSATDGIDSIRRWQSTYDGKIRIVGTAKNTSSTFDDGVEVSILKNDTLLWGPYPITNLRGLRHDIELDATSKDQIDFVVHAKGNPASAQTSWNPLIEEVIMPSEEEEEDEILPTYSASADYSSIQGRNQWYYQQFNGTDFADIAWNAGIGLWEGTATFLYVGNNWHHPAIGIDSVRTWEAPESGRLKVTGTAKKRDSASGDGVNVSILKNGAPLWTQLVTDLTGSTHDLEVTVNKGDRIYFVVNCNVDSSYDLTLWDPTIVYTGNLNKPPVTTLTGNDPFIVEAGTPFVDPGYQSVDMYGVDLSNQMKVTGTVDVNTVGTYNLFYNVSDQNHLPAKTVTRTVLVRDTTAPATSASLAPADPDGENGWYVQPVTVTLTASDNLPGIVNPEYSLDGGATWQSYMAPITLDQDAVYSFSYRSTDHAGNVEATQTISFKLDVTPPAVQVSGLEAGSSYENAGDLTPQISVTDSLSGVDDSRTTAMLDTYALQQGATIPLYTLPLGLHSLMITTSDHAGNEASLTMTFRTETSIDNLKALVTRFAAMNWIDNAGIVNSLQIKLDHSNLESFVNEVEAQRGKHISGEAAEYLLRDVQYLMANSN